MKARFDCGLIYLKGYKNRRRVFIDMELKHNDKNLPCLSISGSVRGHMCGQCLDSIKAARKREGFNYFLFSMLYDLWKEYHLNDLHAGTQKQEEFLKNTKDIHHYDYNICCELLKENNLLFDNGYKYGTSWLYRNIPNEALARIAFLFNKYGK